MTADLVEVKLHGLGVGMRKGKGSALAARRADGAEQIGVLVALVGRLARPRAAFCPLPDQAVLLADAGLVLPPDLDGLAFRQVGQMRLQRAREIFL
jgi:hypothetical protein